MFTLHENNIKMIRAALKHHETIWFHGDGNIYHKEVDSDFRKDFSNDQTGPQTYRIKFVKGDQIPATIASLSDALIKAKGSEMTKRAVPKEVAAISTFDVNIDDEEETDLNQDVQL